MNTNIAGQDITLSVPACKIDLIVPQRTDQSDHRYPRPCSSVVGVGGGGLEMTLTPLQTLSPV